MAIRSAEFFAGIGLVRQALEPLDVQVVWANDIEKAKKAVYEANHDAKDFVLDDVRNVPGSSLPKGIELATSSFPCVDLSLAGNRKGLLGGQSGMFWQFARILDEMKDEKPRVVLLENVHGFATSHGGKDLAAALAELNDLGYSSDVFAIDARHFVPQSRPRMFIVGIKGKPNAPMVADVPPVSDVRPTWVCRVHEEQRARGIGMHYVDLPPLPKGPEDLTKVVEELDPGDERWWDTARVRAFEESLRPLQAARLNVLRTHDRVSHRTAYRRTRNRVSVWEIRRDAIAGCLRTTGGGSSKQALVEAGNGQLRVRWMTPKEYARLMGAHDYHLQGSTPNQALFGFGDAVVVDVVRWIGTNYLVPILRPDGRP
jgi:DNA (cytosine-5)-methyltransferase 1